MEGCAQLGAEETECSSTYLMRIGFSSMCVRRVDIRYDGSGRTNEIAREFKDVPGILGPLYVTVCYQHEDGKENPVKVTDADMAAALERVHAAAVLRQRSNPRPRAIAPKYFHHIDDIAS